MDRQARGRECCRTHLHARVRSYVEVESRALSFFFSMRVDSFHCEYVAVPSFVGYIITRGLRRTRNLLELYDEDGVAVVVFLKEVPCEYMLMAKETFLLLLIVVEN